MSSADATPSSTMRIASSAIATPSREDANPGASLTTTAVLPSASVQPFACAASSVGGLLRRPPPRSGVEAGTGLKKCSPTKLAGRCSSAARSSTESEEVFVARNGARAPAAPPRLQGADLQLEVLRNRLDHQPAAGEGRVVGGRANRARTSSGVPSRAPRAADLATAVGDPGAGTGGSVAVALHHHDGGALMRKAWAIPAPIRPPPRTPTCWGMAVMTWSRLWLSSCRSSCPGRPASGRTWPATRKGSPAPAGRSAGGPRPGHGTPTW